jgi:hypothetical protein
MDKAIKQIAAPANTKLSSTFLLPSATKWRPISVRSAPNAIMPARIMTVGYWRVCLGTIGRDQSLPKNKTKAAAPWGTAAC